MRTIYKWSFLLAAPGLLWAAFEMFGWTLTGPQMLFFSVAHVLPIVLLMIWLAAPLFILWSGLTLAALARTRTRRALTLSIRQAAALLMGQALFGLSFLSYERWSHSPLRPVVCIVGIAIMLMTGVVWVRWWLRSSIYPTGSTRHVEGN
ncbi:hypothetical protein [Inhella sp.]|uniref:hypothetical protein n=1 Tax=Inhella sp. TaxID=1921806 RepID=UPI0035AF4308